MGEEGEGGRGGEEEGEEEGEEGGGGGGRGSKAMAHLVFPGRLQSRGAAWAGKGRGPVPQPLRPLPCHPCRTGSNETNEQARETSLPFLPSTSLKSVHAQCKT